MTIPLPEEERATLAIARDLRSAVLFRHFTSIVDNAARTVMQVVAP